MTVCGPVCRLVPALVLAASLSGCLSLGGDDPIERHDGELERVRALPLTTDMPTSGTARYRGQTGMFMADGPVGAGGSYTLFGEVLADLDLEVAFAPGNAGTVTGTAGNFRWEDNSGRFRNLAGSLSTDGQPGNRVSVTEASGARTGTLAVRMAGPLQTIAGGGGMGTATLELDGEFRGAGAAGAEGQTLLEVVDGAGGFAWEGFGNFYVDRR